MSMSDCIKCWNTPCICGYEYRNYSKEGRLSIAANVLGITLEKLKEVANNSVPEIHPMKEENK